MVGFMENPKQKWMILGVALFSNSPLDDNRRNIAEVREAMYGNAQLLELMVKSMYQQAVTSDPRNEFWGVLCGF